MNQDKEKTVILPLFGLPKIIPYLKPYRNKMIRMVTFGLLVSLIDALFPLFNRYILNHNVANSTLEGLPVLIALYIGVLAVQSVMSYVSLVDSGSMEVTMNHDLRNAAFAHLQTLSFSYFNQNSVGYIHARVMSDTGKIGMAVSWRLMDCIWNGSYLIFAIVVMLIVQWRLGILIIALMVLAAVIISLFQPVLVKQNHRVRELNSVITGDLNEGIIGARSIKLLNIEDRMQREFEEDTEKMRAESVRTVRYSAMLLSLVTMMSSFALALVLWRGGALTREGIIRIGTLSVFLSYAVGMIEPLQFIIQNIAAFISIQVNIERFTRLIAEPSDVSDTPEVISRYGDSFAPKYENWEPIKGDIEFKDVSFRYPDGDEYVMEHFCLKVPHGMNIAIVGETGAGKSTLINLVCRFYEPTEGEILIDGRNVRERSQLWLHSNLGYVLQTPHLFSGTVRENLRYGRPEASDEEIIRSLRMVSAAGVVARLGAEAGSAKTWSEQDEVTDEEIIKGLDGVVGEGGSQLSTGEKQLLSFARALLADPKLLILDEATSSIDTLTEKAIQNAIRVVTEGRTSFVVAHRLSTIVDADLILVVQDGKIIEQGTHQQLLEKRGYYYSLYTRQYEEI